MHWAGEGPRQEDRKRKQDADGEPTEMSSAWHPDAHSSCELGLGTAHLRMCSSCVVVCLVARGSAEETSKVTKPIVNWTNVASRSTLKLVSL